MGNVKRTCREIKEKARSKQTVQGHEEAVLGHRGNSGRRDAEREKEDRERAGEGERKRERERERERERRKGRAMSAD